MIRSQALAGIGAGRYNTAFLGHFRTADRLGRGGARLPSLEYAQWSGAVRHAAEHSLPTPVGRYPAGAAACGALDMGGNVWAWCSTLFRPFPYRAAGGREDPLDEGKRVLRGGSWFNNQRGARVMVRKCDRPVCCPNNFGMRLVVGA